MKTLVNKLSIDPSEETEDLLSETLHELAKKHCWPEKALFALQVASDEWVSNVIKYSYGGRGDFNIAVDIVDRNDKLSVIVYDYGTAFDPASVQISSDLSETLLGMKEGGMGLMVMHHVLDQIDYKPVGDLNAVWLTVNL